MRHAWTTTLILLPLQFVLPFGRAEARVAVGQLQISPVIGIAVPVGSLRDTYRAGYTAGLSVDYMAADRFSMGADVNGTHFIGSSARVMNMFWEYMDVTFDLSLAQYGLHLRWYLTAPRSPNPFLEFGASAVTIYSTQRINYAGSRFRTEDVGIVLGFHFGTGFDLRLSKLASGLARLTYFSIEDSGGGAVAGHFWTARFALAFQFRSI